jgi:Ca2+-binding RTX toxin-like protein
MATIPGSQFVATAPGRAVNVVETTTGTGLPSNVAGAFNLEVFVGPLASAPTTPAPGYQGLAVLTSSGLELDLISGAFAVTDNGTGNDTLSAFGNNETVSGGSANVTLTLFGSNDVANGGGQDTITVQGTNDTVNGAGNDLINVFGSGNLINGGSGDDTINIFNVNDTVAAGSGNQLINAQAAGGTINAGSGNDTVNLSGSGFLVTGGTGNTAINISGHGDTINAGTGNDTINLSGSSFLVTGGTGDTAVNVAGNGDTIGGGNGNDTIAVIGFGDLIKLGSGNEVALVSGGSDTVLSGSAAGTNLGQINLAGGSMTLVNGANQYADTVVGFDQAGGDRVDLTTDTVASAAPVNSGADTLITLSDNSTILLKGVTHIDSSFFK